jgi:hypothetical protein
MQANPNWLTPSDDEMAERAILALFFESGRHHRTVPELGREIGSMTPVRKATANLVSYGVITMHGNTLLLTPAAFHCHRLDDW